MSEVVATAGQGRLKCDYVVHAVGPMWNLYDDKQRCAKTLRRTFQNALYYTNNKLKASSIVFPAIGTGTNCEPKYSQMLQILVLTYFA